MTLKELEKDKKVFQIEQLNFENSKFAVWLNDGWIFNDGSHMCYCNTIEEISETLEQRVQKEQKEKNKEKKKGTTEAQKRAKKKYRKNKTTTFRIEFYKNTEQPLIDRLNEQPNKSGYIKSLIKEDINEESGD